MAKADITIRGKHYSVACAPGREDRLVQLADQLDGRIRQIVSAVGDIGDDRLLLVASLALLDELDEARRHQVEGPDLQSLGEEISQAAERIENLARRLEASA